MALKETLRNKNSLKKLFYHTGLLLGTIVCLIAPGNYVRLINSHDSMLMARTFSEKMLGVAQTNIRMLAGIEYSSLLIMIIIIFFTSLSYRYAHSIVVSNIKFLRSLRYDLMIKYNAMDIFFLFIITLAWSLVSNMWSYGALLFILWFTIIIYKNAAVYWIDEDKNMFLRIENSYVGVFLIIIITFSISVLNFSWMQSMAKTTIERNYIIEKAIKEKQTSVKVPLYEEICTNRFTIVASAIENHNNYIGNKENESTYCKKYYGVKMYTREE